MTRFQVWLNVGGVGFLQADTLETEAQAIEVARSIAKRCPNTNTGVYIVTPAHSFRHDDENKRTAPHKRSEQSESAAGVKS